MWGPADNLGAWCCCIYPLLRRTGGVIVLIWAPSTRHSLWPWLMQGSGRRFIIPHLEIIKRILRSIELKTSSFLFCLRRCIYFLQFLMVLPRRVWLKRVQYDDGFFSFTQHGNTNAQFTVKL